MRKSALTTVLVTAAAFSALATALAAPAAAQPPVFTNYLAGYQVTQVGISRATATVVAPTVTCDPSNTQGVAFGIGNEPSVGNLSMLAGVRVLCSGGTPQVFGYAFGTSAHSVQLAGVDPGDHFNLTVIQTLRTVTITAADTTSGGVFRVSGAPEPDNTLTFGAFALEAGSTPYPVPDFGTVAIARPVLENTGLAAWSPTRLVRRSGTTTQITTNAFLPNGNFRMIYRSS